MLVMNRRKHMGGGRALGAYEWYAEWDPYHSTHASSASDDQSVENAGYAQYSKYMEGDFKLGPQGQRAKCGWFAGKWQGGGFTDPAFPNAVCSVPFSNPNKTGGVQIPASTPGVKLASSMSTTTKVAIGAAVVVGAIFLFGGK